MLFLFEHQDSRAEIFDRYRQIEAVSDSRLAKNYNKKNFKLNEQLVLSYYQKDDSSEPSIFSTVYRKDFWPSGVYRILNRTWQYPRVTRIEKTINDGLYEMILTQLEWCKKQSDFKTAIITRSKNSQLFKKFQEDLKSKDCEFFYAGKFCVCEGDKSDCLQHILYHGDRGVFDRWPTPCL